MGGKGRNPEPPYQWKSGYPGRSGRAFADKIAYLHHDMDDAQRAGIITEDDIPVTLENASGLYHKGTPEHFCPRYN